jgi:hypothetical protein
VREHFIGLLKMDRVTGAGDEFQWGGIAETLGVGSTVRDRHHVIVGAPNDE